MLEIPDDRKYLESYEWTTTEDDAVKIGISDFAQDKLGDVAFIELPAEGDEFAAGEEFGVVESIKVVLDLYAPISDTATAVDEELFDASELLNDDPYGGDWTLAVESADTSEFDNLLSPEEYHEQTE